MDRFVQRSKREPLIRPVSRTLTRSDAEPPLKRPRTWPADSKSEDSDNSSTRASLDGSSDEDEDHEVNFSLVSRGTSQEPDEASNPEEGPAAEDSLILIQSGGDAVGEYEAITASQPGVEDVENDASTQPSTRQWVKGQSSIYVDAFNLALQTVLEDEAHLFDEKEKAVFDYWKALGYEAQYLYVRLFLRKTAAWHRIERLGYHSDVSDMEKAICALLQSRILPKANHENFDGFGDNIKATEGSEGQLPGDSFAFADGSDGSITTLEEAVSLLSLEEVKGLAKEAKVQGKNKADLSKALYRMSAQQTGLLSFGLQRRSSSESNVDTAAGREDFTEEAFDGSSNSRHLNRHAHFLSKILAITGPLIRLSEPVFKLFERVHLVFYRSTEWTEKSLTTIILAKMSRRNFPDYIVCRSHNIFLSRSQLLEFEDSLRKEAGVDKILEFNGPPGEEGFRKVLDIFGAISSRWRELLAEEQRREEEVYDSGEGAYLRRFNPAHAYTRIAHKAAYAHGRLHEHAEEHALISELLAQRLFHPARRGYWYQRKALLEEHYMWGADDTSEPGDPERRKQHWRRIAAATCQAGLEDRDCHLIYHYDLQKRLVKLERRLRIPKRLQHDFGHVRLRRPEEHSVSGTQIKKHTGPDRPGAKTVWLDELGDGASEVSVEEMCLSWYRRQGWKGYHSEGGILRTLFAYLFFDVLFLYIPNVFQTAYQTCPLDLRTDAFFPTRASEINHRLVEIANGRAEGILRDVHQRESPRRTCVVGLNWDFDVEDLAELVRCFDGAALAAISKVMAQEYTARGGGVPDLVLWRPGTGGTTNKPGREEDQDQGITRQETCSQQERSGRMQADAPPLGEVLFAEVKSANDRLSDTQRLWIHVLTGAGVRVALCNAVAREIKFIG